MAYTTGSMTSSTPAKDLMATLKPLLVAGGLSFVETVATPGAQLWSGVTFGGGLFVAVASGSSIAATSPDGVTWTQRALPVSTTWKAVAYGNGVFVALASATTIAASSPDGITWTQRVLPIAANWSSVAFGLGLFVAVSSGGSIAASSPDGITWTQRAMASSAAWSSVTFGNNLFVAVAGSSANVGTSTNGTAWGQTSGLPAASAWNAVTYGNGVYVAVATGASGAYSSDGSIWTTSSLANSAAWASVTFGGGSFFSPASGQSYGQSSPDGITWTQRTLPVTGSWSCITYGAGTFVTAASGQAVAATSQDAITFVQRVLGGSGPNTSTADVYKSAAASNQLGSDWYMILRRSDDSLANMNYQIAEQYSSTLHLASNAGGTGSNVTPISGSWLSPAPPVAPDVSANFGANSTIQLSTSAVTYFLSVNANRMILSTKIGTSEYGIYVGLFDDVLLPAGTNVFPLAAIRLAGTSTGQVSTSTIGGNTSAYGGFTREPLQYVSSTSNFEGAAFNGYTNSAVTSTGYSPLTSASALYGNVTSLSRIPVGSARATASTIMADGARGLLIGCVCCAVSSSAGDTITVGGKTYVRFVGPAATYGYWVDQAL